MFGRNFTQCLAGMILNVWQVYYTMLGRSVTHCVAEMIHNVGLVYYTMFGRFVTQCLACVTRVIPTYCYTPGIYVDGYIVFIFLRM